MTRATGINNTKIKIVLKMIKLQITLIVGRVNIIQNRQL